MSPDDEFLLDGLVRTVEILAANPSGTEERSRPPLEPVGGEVAQMELEELLQRTADHLVATRARIARRLEKAQ